MNSSDAYLTEYYQNGTGDQFFPGCPASVSPWFQRDPEESRTFFPPNNSFGQNGEDGDKKKEE